MVVRSLWLGVIEDKRPDLCQWFFKVDLAPPILGFLCLRTGGCCGKLVDLNVDCKFCTVHHWFASIPPLLLSVTMMVDAGRFRKYEIAQKGKNRFIEISGGILVCITLSLFLLYGLRIFWKRGYDREYENDSRNGDSQVEGTDSMAGIARYASRTMMVMMAFEFMYTMVCVAEYNYSFYV